MLSVPHLIIIFLVALVVFGPEKLPELARNFGKVMAEFRRATGDLRSTFEDHMRDLEREAGEHRIGSGRDEMTAPFKVTGSPNASAPANVVASTPLSNRMRPDVSAIVPGETDVHPFADPESGEAPPSIGEMNRRRMPGRTPESVLDPAASLAPTTSNSNEPTSEDKPKSEIVNDGHSSS